MNVPFIDLKSQHRALQGELNQAIQRVMERGDFALGKDVVQFEEEFADFCGTHYAVGVDCGLSALKLSLLALGIGPGNEVILPANTFIATAAAVTFSGALPVLVDVDATTHNIDVEQIESAITPNTRAIIPVHLYGLPAEMDKIIQLADQYSLAIVEDACQAHGAYFGGRRVGSLGNAAAFSFYPTKNLGGCGDSGMVVTNDRQVAEQVRAMRNCGQKVKHVHELPPYNHRLDTLQAAILRVKLRYLDDWIEARQRNAALYNELLAGSGFVAPFESSKSTHVYHLYVVRTSVRDALQTHLQQNGIGSGIHYPIPIHLQPFYAKNGSRQGQFPVTEQLSGEILSLPMFPEMALEQVQHVADTVIEFGAKSQPMPLRPASLTSM
jgi:dTDP-4-amino-4,6-dideoxygalactose transaminase